MQVAPIQGFTIPRPAALDQPAAAPSGASFQDFLNRAMSNVVATDAADKVTGIESILGTVDDIHTATIAANKAEIALNLTIQIRNKLVEAYQEIMRMQV